MPVAQQTDQQALHQVFLTDNDLIHAQRKGIDKRTLTLNALLQFSNIYCGLHSYVVLARQASIY